MIDPISLATTAAIISAMADVITLGKETFQDYLNKRKQDSTLRSKENALRTAFSTYSDKEVEAIQKRIENCRQRFIEEGAGTARKNCLCSVLTDVRNGNGGRINDPEWENIYNTLNCIA